VNALFKSKRPFSLQESLPLSSSLPRVGEQDLSSLSRDSPFPKKVRKRHPSSCSSPFPHQAVLSPPPATESPKKWYPSFSRNFESKVGPRGRTVTFFQRDPFNPPPEDLLKRRSRTTLPTRDLFTKRPVEKKVLSFIFSVPLKVS